MTDRLSEENREALVAYRMERARQSLEEAAIMRETAHYNAAINRLYYACFYAASALLISNAIEAGTHKGVRAMLSLNFILAGKIDKEHGKTFSELNEKRNSNDYDDFIYCDLTTVNHYYPRVEAFITAVEALL